MVYPRFEGIHAQVLGISVDSKHTLKAWAESLGGITYPLLADFYPHGQVSEMYDVMRAEGHSERAIYVLDDQGIIRFAKVYSMDEQPDNEELFAALEALLSPDERQRARQRWDSIERAAIAASPSAQAGMPGSTASLGRSTGAAFAGASALLQKEEEHQQLPVTLYCTPWCPDCRRVRAFFKERDITFAEFDITRDRAAAQKVRGWTGGYETTPTFDVGGTVVIGFKRAQLAALLNVPE